MWLWLSFLPLNSSQFQVKCVLTGSSATIYGAFHDTSDWVWSSTSQICTRKKVCSFWMKPVFVCWQTFFRVLSAIFRTNHLNLNSSRTYFYIVPIKFWRIVSFGSLFVNTSMTVNEESGKSSQNVCAKNEFLPWNIHFASLQIVQNQKMLEEKKFRHSAIRGEK